MFNPIQTMLTYQTSTLNAWLKVMGAGSEIWRQWFDVQQRLLKDLPYNRIEKVLPKGASFLDGYGRRSHDIDPEHDV